MSGSHVEAAAPTRTAPAHVAIIMDGNGRWANARGLPRAEGHRRGVESLRRIIKAAVEIGISYITVYSFSSENWRRPAEEVSDLMGLAKMFVRSDLEKLHKAGIKVRIIGRREGLAADLRALIDQAEQMTAKNTGLTLIVAFNYGARQEIADAARAIALDVSSGQIDAASVDENTFAAKLTTSDIPDPDLVIRTSGEMRISNFLLWQCAYAEFVFAPTLWPDFDKSALVEAIEIYHQRERRFGAVSPGVKA
jgi:undecaprenyl diphosphate synthase